MVRKAAAIVTALIALTVAFVTGTVAPANANPASITYALATVQATPTFRCNDVACGELIQWAYDQIGVPICDPTDASPCDGTFSWTFSISRLSATDPCRMKSGTGVLNVTWADSSTTIASFTFKSRDSKSLSMTGSVTGGSNTSLTGDALKGNVSYTLDLCKAGLVRATITLT
jgi:hypothetical protein